MAKPLSAPSPILGQHLPVELMNTVWTNRQGIHDALASPDVAQRWIEAIRPRLDLPTADDAEVLSQDALVRVRALRDGLRRIAAERTADPREQPVSAMADLETAVQVVNETARLAHVWPTLTVSADGGITDDREPAGAREDLLVATLATQGIELFSRKADLDLRACLAPGCVLYFIKDHPRRQWCSNACGNCARAARYYARHGRPNPERGAPVPPPSSSPVHPTETCLELAPSSVTASKN
ncbi:CGNR zinc finger domain-containing protein [Ruania alba]|uniref:CGNR zinc finger domain-containing protein n=1 Tax=Ruania alba TaxID=648782 RepID=A0A1H5MYJ4_9MICO|nr:CGNR zinc finger domain-containing protein [Ruania alba]SEE93478.1 CGNR zinc finger domain-containing protein [Ruania alba]